MAITVPQPAVSQDGAGPGAFSAAKAITLTCSPVTLADGTTLDAQHASKSTYVLYRQSTSSSALEAWNSAAKSWQASDPPPAGDPLFFKDGLWTGILVGAGQKDSSGKPLFDPGLTGSYSVACFFAATDAAGATELGSSSRSQPFAALQPGADNRGGLSIVPQDPTQATQVQLFLKDASLATQATVTLASTATGYSLTLAAGGATVELDEAGGISLTPAGSRTVYVAGQLEIVGSLSLNGVVTT